MKVLFVCAGNTCRSPLAQGICEKLYEEKGIEAKSAGLFVFEPSPASEHGVQILKEIGVDMTGHISQSVSEEMLDWCDRAYAMTYPHYEVFRKRFREYADKIFMLDDLNDVQDPFGHGRDKYDECARHLVRAIKKKLGDV